MPLLANIALARQRCARQNSTEEHRVLHATFQLHSESFDRADAAAKTAIKTAFELSTHRHKSPKAEKAAQEADAVAARAARKARDAEREMMRAERALRAYERSERKAKEVKRGRREEDPVDMSEDGVEGRSRSRIRIGWVGKLFGECCKVRSRFVGKCACVNEAPAKSI